MENQEQPKLSSPQVTLTLTVPEVNQVIAGLENFTKPLIQKIVDQAQQQLGQ